ncbi:MAG: mechanosensitive ion channel domain-containing protein [Campylobacterota bacterium]
MGRYLLPFIFLSTLLVSPLLSAEETTEVPTEQVVPVEEAPKFIELSRVPEEAAKVVAGLNKIADTLAEHKETLEIHKVLPAYVDSIDVLLKDPIYKNLENQTIRTLQKHRQEWKIYSSELAEWDSLYKTRIEIYDVQREKLQNYSQLWSETHINATKESAPEVIQNHIANVIIEIEELRNHAKKFYDFGLTDANLITTKLTAVNEVITLLQETEIALSTRIFYQNQLPLSALLTTDTFSPVQYVKSIYSNLSEKFEEFMIYNQTHQEHQIVMFFGALLITGFVGYFNWLYRKKRLFVSEASMHKEAYFFIALPFSTVIILMVLLTVVIYDDAPKSFREIILYIALIPFLRIIQTVVHKKVEPYFYTYFLLYFLSLMEKNAIGYDLDDRFFNIALSVGLIGLIIRFIHYKVADFVEMDIIRKIIYKALPLITLLLVVSILANLYGAMLLSEKISQGVFTAIHSSIIFYVLTIILSGYVIILLRRRISTATNILELYAAKIERTVTLVIKIFMVLWWFKILIRVLGLEPSLNELIDALFELTWEIGSTTISFQAVVYFVSILVGTWLLARLVQILLKVEIFARFQFSRGVPTAISTTSNYIILISGILIAFSSLGVSTEQFAIVFGALGVGIGFGLRNIIANFISGIIMVFERPIQIGDTIEVDNTMGKVLAIGSRASSVKTFDGSEVIVPNERFISSKVINWTLSDERRRKVLQIKVAFDSDIETVLEIMRDVALSNNDVLKDPAPLPTFQGFGDYYLEFKLYYWLTENLIVAQSDVAIAIYKRLKAENIATPMPIQELIMPNEK